MRALPLPEETGAGPAHHKLAIRRVPPSLSGGHQRVDWTKQLRLRVPEAGSFSMSTWRSKSGRSFPARPSRNQRKTEREAADQRRSRRFETNVFADLRSSALICGCLDSSGIHRAPRRNRSVVEQPTWESSLLSFRLWEGGDGSEGAAFRDGGGRVAVRFKMRASVSLRDSRCGNAQGTARFVSGVAICSTRLDEFRSWQSTATIAVGNNLRVKQCLRRESRPIVSGQKRPKGNNALWRLEIRPKRKKSRRSGCLPASFPLSSSENRRAERCPEWVVDGHKRTKNRPSSALQYACFCF
jgi:hypothetical protein